MNQNNNKTLKNELEDLQYELSIVPLCRVVKW